MSGYPASELGYHPPWPAGGATHSPAMSSPNRPSENPSVPRAAVSADTRFARQMPRWSAPPACTCETPSSAIRSSISIRKP